jgi:hypothetical protein
MAPSSRVPCRRHNNSHRESGRLGHLKETVGKGFTGPRATYFLIVIECEPFRDSTARQINPLEVSNHSSSRDWATEQGNTIVGRSFRAPF